MAEPGENCTLPVLPPDGEDVFESGQSFIALLVLLLATCFTFGDYVTSRTKYLTESSFACLVGLCGGLVMLIANLLRRDRDDDVRLSFPAEYFFDFLLPPIIFYQGFSCRKTSLFRSTAIIATFGVVGTLVSFAVISLGCASLRAFDLGTCLRLGSVMAATDSVAVLQILNPLDHPTLHPIVFGEGVLNDASSIVLLRSVRKAFADKGDEKVELNSHVVTQIVLGFVWTFALSLVIGVCVGLVSALIMKLSAAGRQRRAGGVAREGLMARRGAVSTIFENMTTTHQSGLIVLLAYLAYIVAEAFSLSGIMTLFFCGMFMAHYTYFNIEPAAQVTTMHFFCAMSLLCEITIYLYVGISSLYYGNWTNVEAIHVVLLILVLFVCILASRAMFVFPVLLLANRVTSQKPFSFSEMGVVWWSGMMRGAVSVALVLYSFAPGGDDAEEADAKASTVIASVMALVLVCILFLGMGTKPILGRLFSFGKSPGRNGSLASSRSTSMLNLGDLAAPLSSPLSQSRRPSRGSDHSIELQDVDGCEEEDLLQHDTPRGWIHTQWEHFDQTVMKPIFGGEGSPDPHDGL